MASYPGSVVSYPTRNPGETIASAIVNSLQDEIMAIESGLRTGTAPVFSSGTTVASLAVLGASTFTGDASFSTIQTSRATVLSGLHAGASTFARVAISDTIATTAAPSPGTLYANNLVKAWGLVSSAGVVVSGFNLSTVIVTTLATFHVKFAAALPSSVYGLVASGNAGLAGYVATPGGPNTTGFDIRTSPEAIGFFFVVVG